MPPDPLEGQNNSPRRFAARKNSLGQALPPSPPPPHKNLATTLHGISDPRTLNDPEFNYICKNP